MVIDFSQSSSFQSNRELRLIQAAPSIPVRLSKIDCDREQKPSVADRYADEGREYHKPLANLPESGNLG